MSAAADQVAGLDAHERPDVPPHHDALWAERQRFARCARIHAELVARAVNAREALKRGNQFEAISWLDAIPHLEDEWAAARRITESNGAT